MGKIYFASDFHLGVPDYQRSLEREKCIVRWLEMVRTDAEQLFLVGDIFDFWFEYKYVVPKNYVRLLGKLAELSDSGIKITFFTGNHDMWAFDYLEKELGFTIYRNPALFDLQGKKVFIGHGDGLGPGDQGYKFIKKVFANPFCQWLFARIHPNTGIGLANYWSGKSRAANPAKEQYKGRENEWLVTYIEQYLQENTRADYFIFGHRHLPLNLEIQPGIFYLNLGDWFNWNSYAVMENGTIHLRQFESDEPLPLT
ncbi:MAG: UDP-2,3-diacylglucosamine diphosphatase [Bacteroidia bacterium]|nr:UDP-2,3-diacylglucosamine diphosphatase [Bacteroidia bacterium]